MKKGKTLLIYTCRDEPVTECQTLIFMAIFFLHILYWNRKICCSFSYYFFLLLSLFYADRWLKLNHVLTKMINNLNTIFLLFCAPNTIRLRFFRSICKTLRRKKNNREKRTPCTYIQGAVMNKTNFCRHRLRLYVSISSTFK